MGIAAYPIKLAEAAIASGTSADALAGHSLSRHRSRRAPARTVVGQMVRPCLHRRPAARLALYQAPAGSAPAVGRRQAADRVPTGRRSSHLHDHRRAGGRAARLRPVLRAAALSLQSPGHSGGLERRHGVSRRAHRFHPRHHCLCAPLQRQPLEHARSVRGRHAHRAVLRPPGELHQRGAGRPAEHCALGHGVSRGRSGRAPSRASSTRPSSRGSCCLPCCGG